jgi:two-component system CheB/CheR fusion protein
VTGISILVTDMTEHKQAQEALQKSENLFRLIATNSPDVIFAQDRDLRYKWIVNPASPLPAEQVIGKTDWDLLPSEQAQHLAEFKKKILETGVSIREEILLSPGGSQRWFDAIYQPLYDQNQQIVGIVCYARDITERVHAEEKIRSLASQLTMAEQEERQRISQILHDDLQQRLFAIRAQLSVLEGLDQKERVVPGIYSHLNEIETSLTEAITLTRKLSMDFSPVVLQGKKFTDVMTWLSSRMLEQHGLQVELEAREDFDHLDNHMRMLLFQSVSELLFNIVKHAGILKAKITLDQDDQCSRLTISDNGNGFDVTTVMADSKIAHGLLVLQDRLGMMGCKMEITSEPGKGTRVTIEVPRGTP